MNDLFFSTMERLTPALLDGDLETCEHEIAKELKKLRRTPFHIAFELSILNDPADAANHFDRFFAAESKRFQIGAAYTEMNGFDINPNRWYCDLFAYEADGGHDDYSWLSDWQSKRFDEYEINGLEPLQGVFASDAFRDKANRDAIHMADLMVVVKFQKFMRDASSHMKLLRFPLYVTAHDFDFITSFDPRAASERTPVRKMSADEMTDELIEKLRDADSNVRFRAVSKLYSLGPAAKRAVPLLLQLLDDANPVGQMAVMALARIDPVSDAVVSALVSMLVPERPKQLREEIVRALGHSPTSKAVEALASALRDEDRGMRKYAAISLKLLGADAKKAGPALRKLMETETDDVIRAQAEVALKRMGE